MPQITSYFTGELSKANTCDTGMDLRIARLDRVSPAASKQGRLSSRARSKESPGPPRTDVILAMQEPYMAQLVDGTKIYEFRKYLLQSSVERIWFYRTAPYSSLDYVCEILPARTRKPGDPPLEEDGIGNVEFNTGHQDWIGYDYAYRVTSVRRLNEPIPLKELIDKYGIKSAPRGMIYTPTSILEHVDWRAQARLR